MSQLNNSDEIINEQPITESLNNKISKSNKKIIIFLILFTVIAITITIVAIFYTNNQKNSKISISKEVVSDNLGIKSLTEQYNENDLDIIELTDHQGNRTPKYDYDDNYSKITLDYIQIDGLKNTELEAKINSELKYFVYSLYSTDELNDNSIDFIRIYAYCQANFGNVLSIYIDKNIYYTNPNKKSEYKTYCINYDLTTGNKIKFTDLFTNTSIRNILTQSIYDSLINEYFFNQSEDENYTNDISKLDLSNIENDCYILLNKIMTNINELDFYFTPSFIALNDYGVSIDMVKYYDKIAIYNRFKTDESIFDETYKGKQNLFVFSSRYGYNDEQYSLYEDALENLRIEIYIGMPNELLSNSYIKERLNELISTVKSETASITKTARTNPNNAYVYTASFDIYTHTDYRLDALNIENEILNIYGASNVYQTTAKYYNEVYYKKIATFYNSATVEANLVFWDDANSNPNVSNKILTEFNESLDIHTQKTAEQILSDHYLNNEITLLNSILEDAKSNINIDETLNYAIQNLDNIKTEHNLTNEDIKDATNLIKQIQQQVIENKKQSNLPNINTSVNSTNNTVNNNTIINSISNITSNNIENQTNSVISNTTK